MSCNARHALGATALLLMAGCAPVDLSFGEAVRYDMAAQTIDPAPVYAETDAKPGSDGQVGAKAVERYRKGAVKQPSAATIGNGGVGGNGGGMGGAPSATPGS